MRIVIAGWAGQGVRFMGKAIGRALFEEGLRVRVSAFYTAAVRYGYVISMIVASEGETGEIVPEKAEYLVLMSPRALDRASRYMDADFVIRNGRYFEGGVVPPEGLPDNAFFSGYLYAVMGRSGPDPLLISFRGEENERAVRLGFTTAEGGRR